MEPESLDPAFTVESAGLEVVRLLFDPLTEVTADLRVVPGAAESWVASPDNTTFTFTLADGATFADGSPVTADDFVYAFNRLADPDLASPVAYKGSVILGWDAIMESEPSDAIGDTPIEGVRAVDDRTLEIRTAEPFVLLPALVSDPVFSPVPAAVVEADQEGFAEEPVGNGSYAMDGAWVHDDEITVARRSDIVGATGPQTIEFRIFSDPQPQYAQAVAGNLDIADVPAGRVAEATGTFGASLVTTELAVIDYLALPTDAPFDNADLRAALSMAIDRDAIAERVLEGTATAAAGTVPASLGGVTDACPACTFDPEQAAQLYEQAGGLPDDEVTLFFAAGEGFEDVADSIANDWRTNLGLDTELAAEEFDALFERLDAGDVDGPFETAWAPDYPSPLSVLAPLFESTSGDNLFGYANPQVDALLAQARAAPTEADANALLAQAQRVIDADLPVIPLFALKRLVVTGDRVRGVVVHPQGYLILEQVELVG